MKNTTLIGICLVMLVGCDDLGQAISPNRLEIVEANGETFVLDNFTGSVSIVSGDQLRPLELASSEIFELSYVGTLGNSVVDFELLFSGSQVYWSGRIEPDFDSQQFESDEEYDLFVEKYVDNIKRRGNRVIFDLGAITRGISFAKVVIEISELDTRNLRNAEHIGWQGRSRKSVSLDYELIESLGGSDIVRLRPTFVLQIPD